MKKLFLFVCLLNTIACFGQKQISSQELIKDVEILWQALNELHPGIYRHTDTLDLTKAYEQLLHSFSKPQNQSDVFLELSEFVSKIKCGHTYLNPYNQNTKLISDILSEQVLLPFGFKIIENKMIVDHSLEKSISRSDIIKCINNIPVGKILDSLCIFIKTDGNNYNKKLNDLEVSLDQKYNYFDYYFHLVYGFKDCIEIELEHQKTTTIPLVNSAFRKEHYPAKNQNYDEQWSYRFENNYAYLKLGTFVTWKMSFDWESYLDQFFEELDQRKLDHLIIDLRDNEGGLTDVRHYLTNKLAQHAGQSIPKRKYIAYKKVSDNLKPHLNTWSRWFYNTSLWTKKLNDDYRTPRFSRIKNNIKKNKSAYQGNTYVLINAANSSGTFSLAEDLKHNNYATLIGTKTGGSKRGINGGQIFFLTLPNSKIEIDIPLIGEYPISPVKDEGINPNIEILNTLDDHRLRKDRQLEYIINQLINAN